jgi:hypothetical protein
MKYKLFLGIMFFIQEKQKLFTKMADQALVYDAQVTSEALSLS